MSFADAAPAHYSECVLCACFENMVVRRYSFNNMVVRRDAFQAVCRRHVWFGKQSCQGYMLLLCICTLLNGCALQHFGQALDCTTWMTQFFIYVSTRLVVQMHHGQMGWVGWNSPECGVGGVRGVLARCACPPPGHTLD